MAFIKKIRIIEFIESGQDGMNPMDENHELLRASEVISKVANSLGLFQKIVVENQNRIEYEITPCSIASDKEYLNHLTNQRNKLNRQISTLKKATMNEQS